MGGHGFPAEEFLTARMEMDGEIAGGTESGAPRHELASRYAARLAELARRLEAEPEVSAVAFVERLPGQEWGARIGIEGVATHPARAGADAAGAGALARERVRTLHVDGHFFRAFDIPVLAGRGFHSGDAGAAAAPVIVNRTFGREYLGDGSAVGRRLRLRHDGGAETQAGDGAEAGRWHEIVGVVGDLPSYPGQPERAESRVYHPMDHRGTRRCSPHGYREVTPARTPAASARSPRRWTRPCGPALAAAPAQRGAESGVAPERKPSFPGRAHRPHAPVRGRGIRCPSSTLSSLERRSEINLYLT
jgi:hypothetical protein